MNITELLINLIISLALAGGFGYINYYILKNIGDINIEKDSKDEKSFSLILFSILNILLFYGLNCWIENIYISIILALFLTLIFSFTIFKWIIESLNYVINKSRGKSSLGEINTKSVRTLIFDKDKVLFVYLYHLETDKLLSYGCMGWQNENKNSDFDFEIIPTDISDKIEFEDAVIMAQKNANASIYINVDKKIKMIVIPEPD